MGRNSVLLKNTLIISIGKICTQLITYLLLPIYTAVLSTSEYGTIDLLITYIMLISPVITIQMESSIFRFLIDARGNRHEITRIITNCIACTAAPSLAFALGFAIIAQSLNFEYTEAFLAGVLTNSILSIALQIARGLGDNMTYAVGSAIAGILTVLLNIVLVIIWPFGVSGMLYSTAIAQFLAVIYILYKDKVFTYIDSASLSKQLMKKMAGYSAPLILNGLSWWIISASDRTIVSAFIGTEANGILAVATKFSAIVANVFVIFNLSWTESVALHIKDNDRDNYISDITNRCFNLFSSCGIILIMVCAVFFKYLVNENFLAAFPLIPLLVVGGIINVIQTLYGIIYIGLKDTKKVSQTSFIAAIINLIVCIALVKIIGLYAAAISTIVAMLYLAIYRYTDINRTMNIKLRMKDIAIILIAYGVFMILYWINNTYINIAGLFISIIATVIWNKTMVKGILSICNSQLRKMFPVHQ